jgi:RNA polymerase sigma-70 factor (ECF subfamily)
MNDREALEKLRQAGRPRAEAVKYLYRRYAPRFLGYYLRHGLSHREADALVRDTFVATVRQCDDYFGDARADAWLWANAREALLAHFRSRRPEEIPEDYPIELLVDGQAAPVAAQASRKGADPVECRREAYAAFAAANADRAEMLARVALDGWTVEDVAAALRRTPDAARGYLAQSREKLRVYLEPCGELAAD